MASDIETDLQAYRIWEATTETMMWAGMRSVDAVAIGVRIELLYRALVVVMARRAG